MKQQDYELWAEYSASMAVMPNSFFAQSVLKQNLENERAKRREYTQEQGKFFVNDPLKPYEQNLALIATTNCKSRQGWQNDEADDMRICTTGIMLHKSAEELLEHYRDKIQSIYRTESLYERQIADCKQMIVKLGQQIVDLESTNQQRALQSAKNKLKHWQERLTGLQCGLAHQQNREKRIEQKCMKWLGITEKIKIAETALEIKHEKASLGNKYGFNPKAQSRETAEIMFLD